MDTIHSILMSRDGMSTEEADDLICEAKEQLQEYLEDEDHESAENVCEEFFGLEPDYLMEIMPF